MFPVKGFALWLLREMFSSLVKFDLCKKFEKLYVLKKVLIEKVLWFWLFLQTFLNFFLLFQAKLWPPHSWLWEQASFQVNQCRFLFGYFACIITCT